VEPRERRAAILPVIRWLSTDSVDRDAAAGTAVPEPGSWMILLRGAAIVGGVLRRRRPVVALA
jgi:hypothetical protein